MWTLEHRVGDGFATCQPDVSERAIGRPKRASEEGKKNQGRAIDAGELWGRARDRSRVQETRQ